MKILCRILPLICLSAVFSAVSCSDVDEELREPYVEGGSDAVKVTVVWQEDMKYVSIFRRTMSSSGANATASANSEICIGQIHPTDNAGKLDSYPFTDTFCVTGKFYQYKVRYQFSDGYEETAWSATATASGGAGSESTQVGGGNAVNFTWNATSYSLTAAADISCPSVITTDELKSADKNGYYPAFVIEKSKTGKSKTFSLSAYDSTGSGILSGSIEMKRILSSDFLDTALVLRGIVYEKTEYKDKSDNTKDKINDSSYSVISWSPLTAATISDSAGKKLATFTVPSTSAGSGGYDYP